MFLKNEKKNVVFIQKRNEKHYYCRSDVKNKNGGIIK